MAKKSQLRNIHVLLADHDNFLSQAVVHNLRAMGFEHIHQARNGVQALNILQQKPVHFMITEWGMPSLDGVSLIKRLREDSASPNRTLPIIMLTGRGEQADVIQARDVGVNEYLIKPFATRTLFARLQQIIDQPRGFVVTKSFIGPDRRRKEHAKGNSRRTQKPITVSARDLQKYPNHPPCIVLPDFSIRSTIGSAMPLSEIITPDMLREAEKALAALRETGTSWILENIEEVSQAYAVLQSGYSAHALSQMKEAALSIKSRAGMVDYPFATDVARSLYLFLVTHFKPANSVHLAIIGRHLAVLKLVFAKQLRANSPVGEQLLAELQRLIALQQ